jgi:hypothetical protein
LFDPVPGSGFPSRSGFCAWDTRRDDLGRSNEIGIAALGRDHLRTEAIKGQLDQLSQAPATIRMGGSLVTDSSDVVLAYWNEHRQQFRQSENQRATMTNFVMVITAALSGLVVQQKFVGATVPLGVLIVLIGLFGAVISAKYHERATYHLSQARALTTTLKDMGTLPDDTNISQYRQRHYDEFPRLYRIRLHSLWTGLHLAIAAYGIALTIVAAV